MAIANWGDTGYWDNGGGAGGGGGIGGGGMYYGYDWATGNAYGYHFNLLNRQNHAQNDVGGSRRPTDGNAANSGASAASTPQRVDRGGAASGGPGRAPVVAPVGVRRAQPVEQVDVSPEDKLTILAGALAVILGGL